MALKSEQEIAADNGMWLQLVLQTVTGHWSLPTIWVSWSVKIDADFLK